jgi:hypothetical protein
MNRYRRSIANRVAGGIALFGLILAFTTGSGGPNVPIFFVALALAALIGSLGTPNRASVLGGLHAFVWLLVVAIFISTGSGHIFFLGIVASLLLSIFGRAMFAQHRQSNPAAHHRPPTSYYQPSNRAPEEPQYRGYEQGYQPSTTSEQPAQPLPPSDQYEQPQAQYPQQMPPQQ